MSSKDTAWVAKVEKKIQQFADKHSVVYCKKKFELAASFEIGCFHALLNYYQSFEFKLKPENLTGTGEYRYLTSPSGNPNNFSYVSMSGDDGMYEIRQQVRIQSDIDKDIAFSPDLVVLLKDSKINAELDKEYAKGKRHFYSITSDHVVAAHECKSMVPFPELMVSFIGLFTTAHAWYRKSDWKQLVHKDGSHLAPSLFVGGCASGVHLRMIKAIQNAFPVNIVVGLHQGTWNLYSGKKKLNRLKFVTGSQNIDQEPADIEDLF